MTVKNFITQHPGMDLYMTTPGGYVYLTPETAQSLLEGKGTFGHPGDPEMAIKIDAEELLPQTVHSSNFSNGAWHLFTEYSQSQFTEKTSIMDLINKAEANSQPVKTQEPVKAPDIAH